jgi:hypothetical protein
MYVSASPGDRSSFVICAVHTALAVNVCGYCHGHSACVLHTHILMWSGDTAGVMQAAYTHRMGCVCCDCELLVLHW